MTLRDANMNRKDNADVDTASRLSAILAEYNTLREEMRLFLQFHRRDTYLLAIVVGGVAAFAGRNAMGYIYTIIPSVIFVYFMCQLMNLHHVSAQAQACKLIERRVNNLFGEVIMDWETNVAPEFVRKRCWPVMLSIKGLMVFLLLMFLVFVCKAHILSCKACIIYRLLLTGLHVAEFVYILFVLHRWSKFDDWAKEHLEVSEEE